MESNKYFSKEVDKYTKILTNFIKKQPKKKILKMRSKKKVLPSSNNSVLRYTQLEQMANNLKNKNFESEKRQRDGLYLAHKSSLKASKDLRDSWFQVRRQRPKFSRSIKKKLRKCIILIILKSIWIILNFRKAQANPFQKNYEEYLESAT